MKRRSSAHITLVLVGTMALATGCDKQQRNVYKTKEDCLQDWGRQEDCEEVQSHNSYYGGSYYPRGYYYGPTYTPGSGRSSIGTSSTRSVAVARGGFGGLSGFHGGGRG